VNNSDTPGFIGALGTMLGTAGINIATFNLGRVAEGEDAIALVGIDQPVPAALQAELKALPQVRYVKVLEFV
jgi:D-3-phosphoglycerate dehydrogenase